MEFPDPESVLTEQLRLERLSLHRARIDKTGGRLTVFTDGQFKGVFLNEVLLSDYVVWQRLLDGSIKVKSDYFAGYVPVAHILKRKNMSSRTFTSANPKYAVNVFTRFMGITTNDLHSQILTLLGYSNDGMLALDPRFFFPKLYAITQKKDFQYQTDNPIYGLIALAQELEAYRTWIEGQLFALGIFHHDIEANFCFRLMKLRDWEQHLAAGGNINNTSPEEEFFDPMLKIMYPDEYIVLPCLIDWDDTDYETDEIEDLVEPEMLTHIQMLAEKIKLARAAEDFSLTEQTTAIIMTRSEAFKERGISDETYEKIEEVLSDLGIV